MKKFFAVLLLLPFFAFADIPHQVQDYLNATNSVFKFRSSAYNDNGIIFIDIEFRPQNIVSAFFSRTFYVSFDKRSKRITSPDITSVLIQNSSTVNYSTAPVLATIDGSTYRFGLGNFPSACILISAVESLLSAGFESDHLKQVRVYTASVAYNVDLSGLFGDVLLGTNGIYRQTIINSLSSLNLTLNDFWADVIDFGSLNYDILDSVNKLDKSYSQVHYFDVMPFTNALSFALSNGYINQSAHDMYLSGYNDLASDSSRQTQYARGVQSYLNSARRVSENIDASMNNPFTSALGDQLNQGLRDDVNSGFSSSIHVQGAVTNQLQRMTNDVAHIKQQLQETHDDTTNKLERQWDGIKKTEKNTADTAAATTDIAANGVKIKGPIEVYTDTDFKANVTIADANLSTINNSISSGANQAMQRWLDEWEAFKASQVDYTALFPGFMESNTNILSSIDSKLDFGFTNVYDVIISALTNLTVDASITNLEFMLLSDYANYINSGGLTGLLDVMDDDEYSLLKDKLFSIGATDTDESYGRWWRYFTGLSTVQANSVLQINELFQANKKLVNDFVDNNDVSSISDPTVFSDILSSLPTLTKVEDTVMQLSNSLDRTGFDELSRLIPELSNSLSSVSHFFDRNYTLPTDVSWVLIPASEELNTEARVITIHPYEHRKFFDSLHYGIAFAYCIVNIILLPKFLLFLVKLFDRIWVKYEGLIQASVQS